MNGRKQQDTSLEARGQFLVYEAENGRVKLEVRLQNETVWLTQAHIAELFQVKPQNITMHLKNIYADGELMEAATCKDFLQVQTEGSRQIERSRKFYNLDAIKIEVLRLQQENARFKSLLSQHDKPFMLKDTDFQT